MSKAIRIHETGGPENLVYEDIEVGDPGPGEVRLRQTAIAVHFADTLMRQGAYFVKPELPAVLGLEAAGIVEAAGPGVEAFGSGDRVAYLFCPGAYAEHRVLPADQLVKLPDGVDERTSAASFLRGMTAQYLLRQSYVVKPGDTVLVHAAAGGVGVLLCQWAKHLGATVFGTVGSDEKAAVAKANGCDHVVNYSREKFDGRVLNLTSGAGVDVVYDSVGRDTYEGNVNVLAPTGYLINYGHSSGLLPPLDAMELNKKSLFFAKVSLRDYTLSKAAAAKMAAEVFDLLASGTLKVDISHEYALADAAQAHRDIADRKTTGSVVLIP